MSSVDDPSETASDESALASLRRARRRPLWWGIAVGAMALLCCGGATAFVISTTISEASNSNAVNYSGCGSTSTIDISGSLPTVRNLDPEQMENAAIIIQVGQQLNVPPRGWVIAVATAMQESTLHNYGHLGDSNDHDSLGLFQQRPSQGWGTPEELTNPAHSAGLFYKSLKKVDDWEAMDLTLAAQTVQKSAFPDAYAKWEPLATELVNVLAEGAARTSSVSGVVGQCTSPGEISASGWTAPVPQQIVSGFRTPERPDHHGIDLGSPRGTEVRAAASGVVIVAACNAFAPDGSPYSCDVDGSPQIAGCGWYVDIQHADGIQTRYCHFQEAPLVQVGQRVQAGEIIGISGTSGNSSGPHVHFEVHAGEDGSNNGAIDPIGWMLQQGISVGG